MLHSNVLISDRGKGLELRDRYGKWRTELKGREKKSEAIGKNQKLSFLKIAFRMTGLVEMNNFILMSFSKNSFQ